MHSWNAVMLSKRLILSRCRLLAAAFLGVVLVIPMSPARANQAPDPGGSSPSYCTSASGTWITGGIGSTDNGGSGGTGAQQPITLYSDYIHGTACITGDLGKYDVTGSWALENGAFQMDTGVIAIQIVSCATNLVVWPLGKRTWEYESHPSDTTGTTDQWVSLPSGSYAVRIWGYGAVEKGQIAWNFAGANSPGDRNFRGISACSNGGTASFPANFGGATEADGSGNPISGSGNPVPPPVPPPVHKAAPGLARYDYTNHKWFFYTTKVMSGAAVTDSYVTWSGTLPSDTPLEGDWFGTGQASPGLARYNGTTHTWYFYMTNSLFGSAVTSTYTTWSGTLPTDVPLVGDWFGLGHATPGLARYDNTNHTWTFYFSKVNVGASVTSAYTTWSGTMATDMPMAGNWFGTGRATPGLARFNYGSNAWYFYESAHINGASVTDGYVIWPGTLPSDVPQIGNWYNASIDTPGLARFDYDQNRWYFFQTNATTGLGVTDTYQTWSGTLNTDTPLSVGWTQ